MNTALPAPLDQPALDALTRDADRAVIAIIDAHSAVSDGNPLIARDALSVADDAAQRVYLALVAHGGNTTPGMPRPRDIPLHLLDTPATRRLLDALRYATECAQGSG